MSELYCAYSEYLERMLSQSDSDLPTVIGSTVPDSVTDTDLIRMSEWCQFDWSL